MDWLPVLSLIASVLVAIWGIYQTYVTKRLEQNIHRLRIGLDQTIQLLQRAREARIKIHQAHVYLLDYQTYFKDPNEILLEKQSEISAYQAELRGLAFAIGDKELLDLINSGYEFTGVPLSERNVVKDEMEIRGKSQKIHTRISQLLELATK